MRLEIPIPLPGSSPQAKAGAPASLKKGGTWRPVDLGPGPESGSEPSDASDAVPGAASGDEAPARYYERCEADLGPALSNQTASGQTASGPTASGRTAPEQPATAEAPAGQEGARQGAPCLLIVSPLLPLPRSLPALVEEALASEPDFRLDWKWPLLTPRAGPWELVVQLCVGTSLATGHTTGRVYAGLDAGSGAYLIVCIDRDPQKLAERHKEVLALLSGARLHRDRVPAAEADPAEEPWAPGTAGAAEPASPGTGQRAAPAAPRTELLPPQQPPPEIYLKEALFSYLAD